MEDDRPGIFWDMQQHPIFTFSKNPTAYIVDDKEYG